MTARETAVVVLIVLSFASLPVAGAVGDSGRHGSDRTGAGVGASQQNATVDGAPFVRLDDGQERIGGTTTVEPGQNVTVVVSGNGLERSKPVEVGDDGRYSASFDFSDVDTPLSVEIDVRAGGSSILGNGTVPGRIAVRPASIVVTSQPSDGTSVQINRVNLPDGGFIVAHRGGADGEVLGASDRSDPGFGNQLVVPLDPPINETTELTLVLYRDTNGNGTYDDADEPYTADGSPVSDQSTVSVEATTTTEDAATTTDGDDETTTTADGDETGTTAVNGPGFGLVAALFAVVIAIVGAGVARRRSR